MVTFMFWALDVRSTEPPMPWPCSRKPVLEGDRTTRPISEEACKAWLEVSELLSVVNDWAISAIPFAELNWAIWVRNSPLCMGFIGSWFCIWANINFRN